METTNQLAAMKVNQSSESSTQSSNITKMSSFTGITLQHNKQWNIYTIQSITVD